MTENLSESAGGPLYPIREVSRLTGVNSVTLRAWERRYGLIQPRRTPKGHRLYAREDIERVERILQWLNRGVPVSQVSELLDRSASSTAPPPRESVGHVEADWQSQCQEAVVAVETFDVSRLDTLFTRSMGLYPVNTAISQLWRPVVEQLETRWHNAPDGCAQRHFFESFLRTRLGLRLYHGNLEHNEPRLLMSRLPDDPSLLWLLLLAFTASTGGFNITFFDAPIPLEQLPMTARRINAQAVLLAGGTTDRTGETRSALCDLRAQLDAPLCICGPFARDSEQDCSTHGLLALDDDPAQAVTQLRTLINHPTAD
ncbi:MerR family transcriptional regulator [Kushneria sinocarnis]|uniref:MerR family transcriptional regulator n=1 Tax=Kushneria sinocarnis TaxID=595502 RepID=A0A420WT72_9GAMM|nr:MerR family transcriptional regulator [Kushneria sinocarnis]RKQ95868.1 MerR family transcriptional regulator [Kushneria sinocarnis]